MQILRKNIKNINFSVNSANGLVRVSAPISLDEETLLSTIHTKLNWIRKIIQTSNQQAKESKQHFQAGDKCNYLGNQFTLEVVEQAGKPSVSIDYPGVLSMRVREKSTTRHKEALLNEWYRAELKHSIPLLIEKWQPVIGKKVSQWGVKKMKTRWGTCNISKKRIWLNLELAKHPIECLEYVVVHEMTHLLERKHNARFKKLLDGFIPNWKKIETTLNTSHINN